jgi:hypothetical protein
MLKNALRSIAVVGAAAAMLAAAPASAAYVWIYYGGYGEVVGAKVVCESGTVQEYGYQSSSYTYYQTAETC